MRFVVAGFLAMALLASIPGAAQTLSADAPIYFWGPVNTTSSASVAGRITSDFKLEPNSVSYPGSSMTQFTFGDRRVTYAAQLTDKNKSKVNVMRASDGRRALFATVHADVNEEILASTKEYDAFANGPGRGETQFRVTKKSVVIDDMSGIVSECRSGSWQGAKNKVLKEELQCDSVTASVCESVVKTEGALTPADKVALYESYAATSKSLTPMNLKDFEVLPPAEKPGRSLNSESALFPKYQKAQVESTPALERAWRAKKDRLGVLCAKYRAYFTKTSPPRATRSTAPGIGSKIPAGHTPNGGSRDSRSKAR